MREISVYAETVVDDPEAVYLVAREHRSNGYKEQSIRIPNDQIDVAIRELQRERPEPSSAAETGKSAPFGYCVPHQTFHGHEGC